MRLRVYCTLSVYANCINGFVCIFCLPEPVFTNECVCVCVCAWAFVIVCKGTGKYNTMYINISGRVIFRCLLRKQNISEMHTHIVHTATHKHKHTRTHTMYKSEFGAI